MPAGVFDYAKANKKRRATLARKAKAQELAMKVLTPTPAPSKNEMKLTASRRPSVTISPDGTIRISW